MQRRQFLSSVAGLAVAPQFASSVGAAGAKSKTILLRSAWDTINIGDIGHTPGTLRVLEQFLPDVKVVLWAASLNERIKTMLQKRFPKVEIIQGRLTGEQGKPNPIIDAVQASDIVIYNSSMGSDTSLMNYCRKIGKPYGWFGQSWFPTFATPENIASLNQTAFTYCRDTITLEMLLAKGFKPPVYGFNPDGCFGIDVRNDAAADAFLKEKGLEPQKFITIQLRTNTQKHPGTDSPLNPANPSPQQQADDERRAEVFRKLVTAWVKQTGLKVLISPEVEKEIKHNKRLILDRLPPEIAKNVVLRDVFWNADEAASVFARAHTVVCHEPHSCIIALAQGTPILHTYSAFHSPKWHMFADIGLDEWLPNIDEFPVDDIIARLMAIHDDYSKAKQMVKDAMAFVYQKFGESTAVIRKVLG